jgi:hypothetical protein
MILDQLFNNASLKEGTVYDLDREYGAPAPEKKQKSQDPSDHNPYPYSPEEDDDYFREIFRKKREAAKQQGVAEGNKKPEPPEADYGDDYQQMVQRVKKLAGLGPLKTVYDPQKRVYRNMPTAQQPKK